MCFIEEQKPVRKRKEIHWDMRLFTKMIILWICRN